MRLQVIVNTDAYDCVCFTSDSSPLLIAQKLSCVFVMMIVTWSMGLSFNDVHPHHHHNGVLLVGPWLCFAIKSCRHLAASRSGGQDQWVYTWGAPVRTLHALN